MCGFAGRFNNAGLPPDAEWAARADRLLAHRGPDGAGRFADRRCELVHRRLALIDLSPTGAQPMASDDGTMQLVFNGEIYNHAVLRAELEARGHRFRGTSDTEVLLRLYEEAGPEMLARLRGMFAFALYDARRARLFAARDRYAVKPLYHTQLGDELIVASEIKALLARRAFHPTLDRQACFDFLSLSYIPEPQTAFAEIKALPPGGALIADGTGVRVFAYDQLAVRPDAQRPLAAAAEQTADAIGRAVRAQSVADVPVAALLSGGIDSSLVVAAYCRETQTKPQTFNAAFPEAEFDETEFATVVSEQYGTHHQTLRLADADVTPELIEGLLLHFDQPFADSSLIPTYLIARAIRARGHICALSGDGGDEAFGGYASFWRLNQFARMMRLPGALQTAAATVGASLRGVTQDFGRQITKAFTLARAGADDPAQLLAGLFCYLSDEQKAALLAPGAASDLQPIDRLFAQPVTRPFNLNELSAALTTSFFGVSLGGDMLRKVDMMSMLAGIEVRVPLLDEAVVASGLALTHEQKTDGRQGKLVLRQLARQWLPPRVAAHRKQGFRIPLDRMATSRFHQMLGDLLLSRDARVNAFLNAQLIAEWLRQFQRARDGDTNGAPVSRAISREGLYQRILMLLALELWLRRHNLNW